MNLTLGNLLAYLRSEAPDFDGVVRGTRLLKRALPAVLSPDRMVRDMRTPVQWLVFEVTTHETADEGEDVVALEEACQAYTRAVVLRWMEMKGIKR